LWGLGLGTAAASVGDRRIRNRGNRHGIGK
jgi:hypothetical protein